MKMETPVERKVPPSSYEYTAAARRLSKKYLFSAHIKKCPLYETHFRKSAD